VLADLLGGHIQLVFASPGTVIPQIKAGKIRALAVTTSTRSAALPDTPTVAESVPGYEAKNWYGILVPARTPNAIVQRLNKEIRAVLAMPDVLAALLAQGVDPAPSTPEQFTAHVRAEIVKWARVVRAAGVKPE
jgi:tripartite-type tricarboxylate transporter receptor subunit TctC